MVSSRISVIKQKDMMEDLNNINGAIHEENYSSFKQDSSDESHQMMHQSVYRSNYRNQENNRNQEQNRNTESYSQSKNAL